MGLQTPMFTNSGAMCFQLKISGEIAASSVPRAVSCPTASSPSCSETPWSREYRSAGGAFLQGNGAGLSGTGGRSPLTVELNRGGKDNDCGSAEFARLADHGSGAGGTGLVGLGGLIEDFGIGASGGGRVGFGGIVDDDDCERCGSGGGGAGLDGGGTTCRESPLACSCNMRGDGADSDTGTDDEM